MLIEQVQISLRKIKSRRGDEGGGGGGGGGSHIPSVSNPMEFL